MKKLRRLYLALACLGSSLSLFAQYSEGGLPSSVRLGAGSSARAVLQTDTIRLTPPSLSELKRLEGGDSKSAYRPLRFAMPIKASISPQSSGQWRNEIDGSSSWRVTISSPGAVSLGLRFARYELPEGAKLFLHSSNGTWRGAYTEVLNSREGISFAHNMGDALTLELNLPQGVGRDRVQLELEEVQYGYRNALRATPTGDESSTFNLAGEPFYNFRGNGLSRVACAPNVVGFPEYKEQARSVVLMVMEGNTIGTGVLINNANRDGTAYVLTAAHNLNRIYTLDPDTWAEVEKICKTIVFFFGFESPSTDQNLRGTEELTLSGAELVAYNTDADMALIKVKLPSGMTQIPDHYNPFFSGWNVSLSPRGTFYNIHHALASPKRLSIVAHNTLTLKDYSIEGQNWIQKHWDIREWSTGTTEAGASGSPLFDGEGRIIGGLSGGRSTCDAPYGDSFFAIAQTWDNGNPRTSLKPWLDPHGSGVQNIAGYDPNQGMSRKLTRVSDYYASSTVNRSWSGYTAREGVSGLGRVIRLSGATEPLGIYIQIGKGNISTPNYKIRLTRLDGTMLSASPAWETELTHYNYQSYSEDTQSFRPERRTIGLDNIELFVPSAISSTLPSGDYLLSIETSNDTKLDLPVLSEIYRTTSTSYAHRAWSKKSGGSWEKDESKAQNLWIDLLVRGDVDPRGASLGREEDTERPYVSYYNGDIVYTYSKRGTAELRIYSIDGFLWRKEELKEGENQTNIGDLPRDTFFVIQIKGASGKHSYKIAR